MPIQRRSSQIRHGIASGSQHEERQDMTTYEVQTLETAPEKSREAMQRLKNSAGMIPNLAAMMSTSPTLIEAFVTLREIYSGRHARRQGAGDAGPGQCRRERLRMVRRVPFLRRAQARRRRRGGRATACGQASRPIPGCARWPALRGNSSQRAASSIPPTWTRSSQPDSARTRRWRSWPAWRCRSWPTMPATSSIRNWTRRSGTSAGRALPV